MVEEKLKRLTPLQEFESERRVVDETEIEPPRETLLPLMVIDELVRPALSRVPVILGVKV